MLSLQLSPPSRGVKVVLAGLENVLVTTLPPPGHVNRLCALHNSAIIQFDHKLKHQSLLVECLSPGMQTLSVGLANINDPFRVSECVCVCMFMLLSMFQIKHKKRSDAKLG